MGLLHLVITIALGTSSALHVSAVRGGTSKIAMRAAARGQLEILDGGLADMYKQRWHDAEESGAPRKVKWEKRSPEEKTDKKVKACLPIFDEKQKKNRSVCGKLSFDSFDGMVSSRCASNSLPRTPWRLVLPGARSVRTVADDTCCTRAQTCIEVKGKWICK